MGSSYKLWDKRLRESDTLTRGQIRQFCNAITAGALGYMIGGQRTNLTPDECVSLTQQFYERSQGYKLTRDHEKFGLEWLRTDTKRATSLGVTEQILDDFKEFRFVDTRVVSERNWGARAHIVPVYRVVTHSGDEVEYSWSPWQQEAYA